MNAARKIKTASMVILTGASIILSSCSSTPEALETSKSAVRSQKDYPDNYQEVYRRLVNTARRCSVSTGSHVSFQVDADLYSDLGFGEAAFSLQDLGARNYYWKAKIERAGTGSKLSVVSGNTLGQDRTLQRVVRWADGDTSC